MDPRVLEIARDVAQSGGRALVVGGYVRDRLLGIESKDVDVEIYGLSAPQVEQVLRRFGPVIAVGRSFGVLRIKGLDVDFSLPRRDSKAGIQRGELPEHVDPALRFAEAARRRDLTINSMAFDPLTGEIVDPHGGQADLQRRILRATDSRHFCDDPLRGLRVARLAARFEMEPDPELVELCRRLDLSHVASERVFQELRRLLLEAARPSLGFEFLRQTSQLRWLPEIAALEGVPQDPLWHPEGDVWTHTQMVLDQAARLRDGGEEDAVLMLAALCHDLGKPDTTVEQEGRIRSPQHEPRGVEITEALLTRLRAPKDLIARVCALVRYHLAPALYVRDGAKAKGYRRLARQLDRAGVSLELLVRLARADHLGRTTDEALAGEFPAGEEFLARARASLAPERPPRDVVLGRHLIARGLQPGPHFRPLLERCREVQDDTGWTDPDRILDAVLERRTE